MKIQLVNGGNVRPVNHIVTSRIRDSLDSTFTLSFTLTVDDVDYINDDTQVEHGGQYFGVSSYVKDTEGQSPICAVECEHISYVLNNPEYALDSFAMTGTPRQLLTAALANTPFTVGIVEPTQSYTIVINDTTSRRAVLYTIAAQIGAEIEYNGYEINLRTHRGSESYIELLDTDNVTHVSLNRDVRENLTSYNIALGRKTILAAGDNIHISFSPLNLDVNTRIISIEYNPYKDSEVDIEVGDYVPDILDSYASFSEQITGAIQIFKVANGEMLSRIQSAEGDISSLEQTAAGLTISINAANGNISSLQQTAAGLTVRVNNAEGDISALEQTATSLTISINAANGNISSLQQTASSLTARVGTAEGNISTVTQTADKINWLVQYGTSASNFTLTPYMLNVVARDITLTGYVTVSDLAGSGTTTINADNLKTGKVSANFIGANNGQYITFNSPLYLNSTYPQIYGLNALYFGAPSSSTAHIRANDAIVGGGVMRFYANTLQRENPSGGTAYTILDSGNWSNYISGITAVFG